RAARATHRDFRAAGRHLVAPAASSCLSVAPAIGPGPFARRWGDGVGSKWCHPATQVDGAGQFVLVPCRCLLVLSSSPVWDEFRRPANYRPECTYLRGLVATPTGESPGRRVAR